MKTMKRQSLIFSIGLLAFSAISHAAVFNVTGVMLSQSQYGSAPVSSSGVTFNPAAPTFSGEWTINADTASFSAVLDFAPYRVTAVVTGFGSSDEFVFDHPHDNIGIDGSGAIFSYDAPTRTLSITQAAVSHNGAPPVCVVCGAMTPVTVPDGWSGPTSIWTYPLPEPYLPMTTTETFSLSLVFDPGFTTFVGTGTSSLRYVDVVYGTDTTFSFEGTAVPVPATLWLFGSGLIGLGMAGRRRIAA